MRKMAIFPLMLAMSACTYVQSQPGAEQVVLFQPAQVARCTQLGTVKVSVLDKVGPIARNADKVEHDLQALGRNSAVDMGGNTITAASAVIDGKQSFNIFRCPR